MEIVEIRAKLDAALDAFLAEDLYLLEVDANERTITFRLAYHLQHRFNELHVDCEYNRMGPSPKRVRMPRHAIPWDDTTGSTVFPDIIVHRRGPLGPNVLVLELKKVGRRGSHDLRKLAAYKKDLSYREAAFVAICTGRASPGFSTPRYYPRSWPSARPPPPDR